jgi:HTH-type transcriptional repressor of NAD biosynthesis genes
MTINFRHGLVIGKFYPPHAGHEYLIRTASDWCDIVTVVAMASSIESISLALRVEWLREIFTERRNVTIVGVMDDEPIDFHSDAIWSAHVAHMKTGVDDAAALRDDHSNAKVDAVFTSESYGSELARRFEAAHVCLDKIRTLYPVSGTSVRKQPAECWEFLAPCVRAYLTWRVVIVGAESTGKTTLAAALAKKLRERQGSWARTQWVSEYGREYSANKLAVAHALASAQSQPLPGVEELRWQSEEFEQIAKEQVQREYEAARNGSPFLICDTDAFATEIWHQRYMGFASTNVGALANAMPNRFGYILTSWQDVNFEQDGLRDGEHIRGWMHDIFTSRLKSMNVPWLLVSGALEQRVDACSEWIDKGLCSAWQFADPLG